MSEASLRFNPFAQDQGRIDLGVDLREGTIPAGARAIVTPNPEPEPEREDEAPPPSETAGPAPTDPGTAAGSDPVTQPQPETKVLTSGSTKQPPRTGPKPRTK